MTYLIKCILLIMTVMASVALAGQCDGLAEADCRGNGACQFVPFLSCCGKSSSYCVENCDCKNELSCGIDAKGEIWEFWTSCKPGVGFLPYATPNGTCDSLRCQADETCEWVPSSPCYGTSCCPRIPKCVKSTTSTSGTTTTTTTSTSGTSGGNICDMIICPIGQVCRLLSDGSAKCVQAPPTPDPCCIGITCPTGYICKEANGAPTCVKSEIDCCTDVTCPANFVCMEQNGQPTCVPTAPTCDTTQCAPGFDCKMIANIPTCVKFDCEDINDIDCCLADKRCALSKSTSCCGQQAQLCVNRDDLGCRDFECGTELYCAVYALTGQIHHFNNTCVPKRDWIQYIPPKGPTCAELKCDAIGQACIQTPTSDCTGGPCCPTIAACYPFNYTAGSTIATTTVSTASTTASTIAHVFTTTASTTASTSASTSASTTTTGGDMNCNCAADEVCCQPDKSLDATCLKLCSFIDCAAGYHCLVNNGQPFCVSN
ncbi:hypothetical protein SAMD00019534_070530, partial [Acytostelium subglobosum LB1]|uniref:Spore coat protein D1 n=1 Tax=Acytostelium subglobosum TaxID=361139 RepID=R4X1W3_ACYSU